jgi:hypothetical protein
MKYFLVLLAVSVFLSGCSTSSSVPRAPAAALPPAPTRPGAPEIPPIFNFKSTERRIAGQVFIVTRGRDTIKLSNIRLKIYPADYLAEVRAILMGHRMAQIKWAGDLLVSSYSSFKTDPLQQAELASWLAWGLLPPPVASTATDADGKFEISGALPESLGIVAMASRDVFGKTEYYVWAIGQDAIEDAARIFLTNDNLLP